jgi:hypothetical protein
MGKSALESLVPPSNEKKSVAVACSRLLIREMEKFHRRNVRFGWTASRDSCFWW